jgi:hypothetical protein
MRKNEFLSPQGDTSCVSTADERTLPLTPNVSWGYTRTEPAHPNSRREDASSTSPRRVFDPTRECGGTRDKHPDLKPAGRHFLCLYCRREDTSTNSPRRVYGLRFSGRELDIACLHFRREDTSADPQRQLGIHAN